MSQATLSTGAQTPQSRAIAMIGGGQMALALAEGFCRAGLLQPTDITVHDPVPAARERLAGRVPGIHFADNGATAAAAARIVFLAVKPQQASAACREFAAALAADAVVVSIVAGLTLHNLAELAGTPRIIRVMPNTPCLVGRGVSVVCRTPEVPAGDLARVLELLAAVGRVHEADETLMDAVTGLSGSGPGFVALLVEALADGGVKAGLPRSLALALATETLSGTAALLEQTGEHPAQIKDRVSSPGGTTIAGLAVLEQRGVRGALIDAVVTAAARARELGK
ncbi:MAG: pyrroline-5-carboxylate reductase [Planctomycetia bacterium]|nr:pyrroline-5-carboxylate reductase [Planctomycetia bacterium]